MKRPAHRPKREYNNVERQVCQPELKSCPNCGGKLYSIGSLYINKTVQTLEGVCQAFADNTLRLINKWKDDIFHCYDIETAQEQQRLLYRCRRWPTETAHALLINTLRYSRNSSYLRLCSPMILETM